MEKTAEKAIETAAKTAKPSHLSKLKLLAKKNSPDILLGVGIACTVSATVTAMKAGPSVLDKVKEIRQLKIDMAELKKEKAEFYTDEEYRKDIGAIYFRGGLDLFKLMAPAITFELAGISCILAAHGMLSKRNAALASAFNAVTAKFAEYRSTVIADQGKEKDLEYNQKATKSLEDRLQPADDGAFRDPVIAKLRRDVSEYAKFFDELSSNWSKSPELNLAFLRSQQAFANDLLVSRGHLFLNEVYDMLGLPHTSAGQLVGWVYNNPRENGDNIVDFGIYDPRNAPFVDGYEPSILLDFNVDGIIYDMI